MHVSLSTFIPSCLSCQSGDADPATGASRQLEDAVRSVAKTARLSRDGQQALLQWSIWVAYATALAVYDPYLSREPGWKIVLPVDPVACRTNLHRLLLRAGESAQTAYDAVEAFYKNNPIPRSHDAIAAFYTEDTPSSAMLDASIRKMAWREWLGGLPRNDLPEDIVPFERLPASFREIALLTTNLAGRDCRNTPGLARLDLRFLYAPDADFEGCDLSESNFFRGDLSRANLKNTRIGGAILPAPVPPGAGCRAPSTPPRPSTPSSQHPKTPHGDHASMIPRAFNLAAWRD